MIAAAARRRCARASSRGTADELVDLADDVDPERDHVRGSDDAPVTLVEYGDYECPYCGQAEVVIRELLDSFGDDLRYVWRHLPLNDVHPNAQMAAEAAEAAAAQGAFWEMHDRLLDHQDELEPADLDRYAEELGLDVDRFGDELRGAQLRRRASRRTWRARTRAASPARRRSSSTAGATRAPTTPRSSPDEVERARRRARLSEHPAAARVSTRCGRF